MKNEKNVRKKEEKNNEKNTLARAARVSAS